MPIITPEKAIDVNTVLEIARPADDDDRERLLELAGIASECPGSAVYVERIVDAVGDGEVTISAGGSVSGGNGGEPVTFLSKPLSRLFAAGTTVYPYVATCGPKMAEYSDNLSDPLERYWWDMIMQNAVGTSRKALFDEIEKVAGYTPVSANPGSIGSWPINNQPALFSLIGDVEKMIGVTVAPSFLMVPLKSVSGIMFKSGGGFTHNCCLCERKDCQGRSAPFDANLKAELEGG